MSIISFGAGVNSTALIIMQVRGGWRGPIVFSDTGCEWPETYCFIDYFEREWLAPRGLSVTRLQGPPWQCDHSGRTLIDYCETAHKIPMAAIRWCTMSYKVHPVAKWMAQNGETEQMIGIAADESHRQPDKWRPLCDAGITRQGCIDIIQAEGISVPRKSGCYICPFQRISGWRELWRDHPDLFERAAALEKNVQRNVSEGRFRVTLDPSGKRTLRELQAIFEGQSPMFDDSEMDALRSYQPCICEINQGDPT